MATEKETGIDPKILREKFDYDNSGILIWRDALKRKGFKKTMEAGKPAFTTMEKKGYFLGRLCGEHIKAHRAIWAWHNGEWPEDQIDHINGDPRDNRIENLRQTTNSDNCKNRNVSLANTSGWTGVTFNKRQGLWAAKFSKNYQDFFVGYFSCPTSAHFAIYKARESAGFDLAHGMSGRPSINSY